MSHQKRSVQVLGRDSIGWTTPRGGRRLIERGLAERVSEKVVRMLAGDPRINCEPARAHAPVLSIVDFREPLPVLEPEGFLHYPHTWQTSRKQKRIAA